MKFAIKMFFSFILVFILHMAMNAFRTPINNNMAMLQLEDSNTALATYNTWSLYGGLAETVLIVLVLLVVFFSDIKKLFKKSK